MDVLQQLIIEEEIPFRHRHKTGVRGVGFVGQRKRDERRQKDQDKKHHHHHHRIHVDLARIKRFTDGRRLAFIPGTGRSDPPKDEEMHDNPRDNERR